MRHRVIFPPVVKCLEGECEGYHRHHLTPHPPHHHHDELYNSPFLRTQTFDHHYTLSFFARRRFYHTNNSRGGELEETQQGRMKRVKATANQIPYPRPAPPSTNGSPANLGTAMIAGDSDVWGSLCLARPAPLCVAVSPGTLGITPSAQAPLATLPRRWVPGVTF